jgi:hypothetical protein
MWGLKPSIQTHNCDTQDRVWDNIYSLSFRKLEMYSRISLDASYGILFTQHQWEIKSRVNAAASWGWENKRENEYIKT